MEYHPKHLQFTLRSRWKVYSNASLDGDWQADNMSQVQMSRGDQTALDYHKSASQSFHKSRSAGTSCSPFTIFGVRYITVNHEATHFISTNLSKYPRALGIKNTKNHNCLNINVQSLFCHQVDPFNLLIKSDISGRSRIVEIPQYLKAHYLMNYLSTQKILR